jgi:hypothetical protein
VENPLLEKTDLPANYPSPAHWVSLEKATQVTLERRTRVQVTPKQHPTPLVARQKQRTSYGDPRVTSDVHTLMLATVTWL